MSSSPSCHELNVTYISLAIYVCLLFLAQTTTAQSSCPKHKLLWHQKDYLDPTLGFNIQVCCNVTAVWAAKLLPDWGLALPAALNDISVNELSLEGSEFVLSTCQDGTITPGYVASRPGLKCSHKMGNILRLQSESTESAFVPNEWYALCYKIRTDSEAEAKSQDSNCYLCSLEYFCSSPYHPSCLNITVHRAVLEVTNTSINVTMSAGEKLPFPVNLEISAWDRRNASAPPVYEADSFSTSLTPGTSKSFLIDNLLPDLWYRIRTCFSVDVPDSFLVGHSIRMSSKQTICLEDASYRTLGYHSGSPSPSTLSHLAVMTVLLSLLHSY